MTNRKPQRLKVVSASELANLPPETAEQAYRRGYHDGWLVSLNMLSEAMHGGMTLQQAWAACLAHHDGALHRWANGCKPDDKEVWPPEMDVNSTAKQP